MTTRPELYVGYLGFGAHNAYFALAAEIGVIGGLSFLVLTVTYATKGLFVATRDDVDPEVKYTALGLSVGLLGFRREHIHEQHIPASATGALLLDSLGDDRGFGSWALAGRNPSTALGARGRGWSGARFSSGSWVSRARLATDTLWRQSFVFSRVAVPKPARASWYDSSVFMRFVFGTGGSDASENG